MVYYKTTGDECDEYDETKEVSEDEEDYSLKDPGNPGEDRNT